MPLDLDDMDKIALVELLREVIDNDPYPLSPRIRKRRRILDKLEPAPPRVRRTQRRSRSASQAAFWRSARAACDPAWKIDPCRGVIGVQL
jgi:hypothetical protein